MKQLRLFVTAALLSAMLVVPAFAWELKLTGESEWRYRYWARTGNNDLFGTMDSEYVNLGINHLQVFPTAATTNRLGPGFGVLAGTNRYGSEMKLNDTRTTIYPAIIVNKAITIAAAVNLTSLGIWSDGAPYVDTVTYTVAPNNTVTIPPNRGYVNSLYVPIQDRPVSIHVPNTYVTVQWIKWSIKTPMLDFSLGYKDSGFGIGLWKHKETRSSTSFGVSATYGPFKIGFSPYFGRKESSWDNFGESRIRGNESPQRHEGVRNYFQALMGELEYSSGPFQFALLSDSYHEPAAPDTRGARGAALTGEQGRRPSEDILRYRIGVAAKYFDGRFFFNAEADYFNRWRAGRGTSEPAKNDPSKPLLQRRDRDNTAWIYAVEMGSLAGPTKLTVNYARATGDDPSTRHTSEDAAVGETGITGAYMKEWGYLMYYMYGTGDGWDAAGWGQPTNFHHVGVKFDYAIAANLNLRAVLSKAWRDQPNAYRFGGDYQIGARHWTNDDIWNWQQGPARFGHAVPDHAREIGWELDLGLDWNLLENFTWRTTMAYWKPGNWWAYAFPNTAHIYRALGGVAATDNPNNATGEARATFNPDRAIDPLIAIETTLVIKF